MNPWWRKPQPVTTEIVEQITAVEIPVITEVNRRLAKGDYSGAIRFAYPKASEDLARAFRIPFPAGMTHEEFLRTRTTTEMGHLPEFFERFYDLYSPLRYGPPGAREDPAQLVSLLKSIYAPRPMWQLYLQPKNPDRPRSRPSPPRADSPPEGSA
jgi:hypothetical protein